MGVGKALLLVLLGVLGVLGAIGEARAGTFRQRPRLFIDRVDVSQAPLVRLYITELDESARVAPARAKSAFRLLVNGLPQSKPAAMQRFTELREPVALMLVIQVSPSMREPLGDIVGAGKRFVATLPDRSRVGIVAYADVVTRQTKLTSPMRAVSVLASLKIREGVEIQLPDAVRDALEILSAPKLPRRRMIVLISDGITADLNFKVFSDLGRQGRDRGIAVHSIGYAPLEPSRLRTLHDLSRRGGGTFRQAPDTQALGTAFEALQEEVENQLVLSYNLAALFDGKVHDFQIEVTGGLASNIVPVELQKKVTRQQAGSLWDEAWVLAVVGLVVVVITVLLALAWRWFFPRVARAPPPRARARAREDEREEREEEEGNDSEDRHQDNHRLRRLTAKVTKEALDDLFRPAPHPAAPMHPAPREEADEVDDASFMHQVDDELSLTGRVSSHVSPHPVRPVRQDRSQDRSHPSFPAAPRPGASAPAPLPGAVEAGPIFPPIPPPFSAASPPGSAPAALPQAQGSSPGIHGEPGDAGFRLPLPDPDEFIKQRRGRQGGSHSSGMPAAPQPPVAKGSSPAIAPVVAGSGIPLLPGPDLQVLPVALATPSADAPPPVNFHYCKTQVIPEQDIPDVDFVAWIVPIDGKQFESIVVRDGFTLGSSERCDLQVLADGVQPEHLVFSISGGGYGLMPGAGESAEPFIPLLRDNDRFHIGSMEFIYKCQSWFPMTPMHEASLVVLDGLDMGRTLELKHRVVYTIGTHPSCALVVRGEGVAARHALVMLKDRKCMIGDLGSETGLRHRGELVGRHVLRPGHHVSMGDIRLLFQLEDITGEQMVRNGMRSPHGNP